MAMIREDVSEVVRILERRFYKRRLELAWPRRIRLRRHELSRPLTPQIADVRYKSRCAVRGHGGASKCAR